MGAKFPIISVLLLVVCLPAAIYLSYTKIADVRKEMYKGREKQLALAYLPVGGLDKFYADTQWVRLIQEMAKQNTSPTAKDGKKLTEEEEKAQRVKQAEYFYQSFDRLSDLDPNNKEYYLFGARFLQNDRPDDAIKLLVKGDNLLKTPGYELPWMQFHIIRSFIVGQNADEEKKQLDKMSDLLKKAMDRPSAPAHIQNKWLTLRAQKEGLDDGNVGRLKLWVRHYLNKTKVTTSTPDNAAAGGAAPEAGAGYESAADTELRNTIMQMAQKMAIENWDKRAKANPQEKAKLEQEHKQISEAFFKIAPMGVHYAPISLTPYEPGDLYDSVTGTPVIPYGVDPDMLEKGVVVVYKGAFSQATGKPRVADEEIARRIKAGELKIPAGTASAPATGR